MAAARRLPKELKDLIERRIDAETVKDDIYHWQIAFHGPTDTPYFGGTFLLDVSFPKDYPFTPPKVMFLTKIYHPNIDHKGNICIAILKDSWGPTDTMSKVMDAIVALLRQPNPDDPLSVEAAKLYTENRNEYMKKAADVTRKYAIE
jgi:ubiquitin-conjugating enzyme E2 D